VVGPENERVPDNGPQYADDADGDEALDHRGDNVLGANQPAIEEGEARQHEEH
jgi:hypothetical protein